MPVVHKGPSTAHHHISAMKSGRRSKVTGSQIAHTIRASIQPLLAISRPFCAAPYIDWDIVTDDTDAISEAEAADSATKTTKQRMINRIYAATYLVFVTFAYCKHFLLLDQQIALSVKFIYATYYLTAYLQSLFIAWGGLHQETEYPYFVRSLADIDVRLLQTQTKLRETVRTTNEAHGSISATTNAANFVRTLRRVYIGLVVFFVWMGCATYVDYVVYNQRQFWSWTRSCTIFVVSNITDVLVLLQLCLALWLLNARYATVNEMMESLLADAVAPHDRAMRLHVLRWIRIGHMRLNRLHVRLTEAFGLLIVCLVLKSVIVLTILLFAAYKYAARFSNWWLFAYAMSWAAVHLLKVELRLR